MASAGAVAVVLGVGLLSVPFEQAAPSDVPYALTAQAAAQRETEVRRAQSLVTPPAVVDARGRLRGAPSQVLDAGPTEPAADIRTVPPTKADQDAAAERKAALWQQAQAAAPGTLPDPSAPDVDGAAAVKQANEAAVRQWRKARDAASADSKIGARAPELPGVDELQAATFLSETTPSTAPAAAGDVFTLSGTVTDESTEAPLSGVCVTARQETGEGWSDPIGSACTDNDGRYVINDLPVSYRYYATAVDPGGPYVSETVIAVSLSDTESVADLALAMGGQLSGQVSDPAGDPIPDVCIDLWRADGTYGWADTCTGADGRFVSNGIAAGTWSVRFAPRSGPWLAEYYDDAATEANATPVEISVGAVTTGIDAVLARGATISGTVAAADTGDPLEDVCVYAEGQGAYGSGYGCTDAAGQYTTTGIVTGSYQLFFAVPYDSDYVSHRPTATVALTTGDAVTGQDASLPRGGRIVGRVVDEVSGDGIQDVCIEAASETFTTYTCSAADGTFTVRGLESGTYEMVTYSVPDTHVQPQQSAVEVTRGQDTTVQLRLGRAAVISGLVRGADGAPLPDVCVYVEGDSYGSGCTGADGTYRVAGLEAGDHAVLFSDPDGIHLPEYWDDQAALEDATHISLAAAEERAGIDAQLSTAAAIAGLVTAPDGQSVDACVTAYSGTDIVAQDCASAGQSYRLAPLRAGSYTVLARHYTELEDNPYLPQWFGAADTQEGAAEVVVTAAATVSGIDITLARGATLSGTLTGAGGSLEAGFVEVLPQGSDDVVDIDVPDALGTWSVVGLPPGDYEVRFQASNASAEWWQDAPSRQGAKAIALAAGQDVSGVDAVLDVWTGSVSGHVTAAETGDPVAACVTLVPADDRYQQAGWACADAATGLYRLSNVRPGQYVALVTDPDGTYVEQYLGGALDFESAEVLLIRDDVELSGMDAALGRGGWIEGQVVDDATGEPASACISIYSAADSWVGSSVCTDSDGAFRSGALAAGDYRLYIQAGHQWSDQWFDRAAGSTSAQVLTVVVGDVTTVEPRLLLAQGSVAGTITSAGDGSPIANACVQISGPSFTTRCTDESGTYEATGLPPGSYSVFVAPPAGSHYRDGSISVVEVAGGPVTGVDVALLTGGRISVNMVDDTTGEAVHGCVMISGPSYQWVCSTGTAEPLQTHGLEPGDYRVRLDPGHSNYVPEYWMDSYAWDDATVVTIAAEDVDLQDATVTVGRSVSGAVTDRVTGRPLSQVCAYVRPPGSSWEVGAYGCTDASGSYRTGGLLPGEYVVEFTNSQGRYVTQWFDDAATAEAATLATVGADADARGIDAQMDLGGNASGQVVDARTDVPMADVCLTLVAQGGGESSGGCTDGEGRYVSPSVLPGDYLVRVDSPDATHRTTFHPSAKDAAGAQSVTITGGATQEGVDVALLSSTLLVGGAVRDAVSNDPVRDACVYLYRSDDPSGAAYGTCVNSEGVYGFDDVAPGSYKVAFTDTWAAHPTVWAGGAQSVEDADILELDDDTTGLDGLMTPVATVAGVVTDAVTEDPVADVCGYLYRVGENDATVGYCGSADGRVILQGMSPGDYQVAFADPSGTHVTGWFGGADRATATVVPITATTVRTDLDTALAPLTTLRVKVVDPQGSDVAGACMYVYPQGASTAAAATCAVEPSSTMVVQGLTAGTYEVAVVDPTGLLRTTWVGGEPERGDAEAITVTDGAIIDRTVALGGIPSIDLTIRSTTGDPLAGVCAYVYPVDGDGSVAASCTGATGRMVLQGFQPGDYVVGVSDPSGARATTWSGQVHLREAATVVTVEEGASALELTMPVVGGIQGVVIDDAGLPRADVCVYVDDDAGRYVHASACTDSEGRFVVGGLAPGGYRLGYYPPGEGSPSRYWNDGAASEAEAPLVTVEAEGTTTVATRTVPRP
ncbi:MAG TPA: carboxypeptidase regulatory-like domain-containing protein [Ornithinibacter sp.]|nr:carboxypeptidase regulatory-like domain-containing protein [Ornithinibacter sp.]